MDKDRSSRSYEGVNRRQFLGVMRPAGVALSGVTIASKATSAVEPIAIKEAKRGEDVFAYVTRVKGGFDQTFYQQVIGASNAFKEGDVALGAGGGKWLIFIEPQA